MYLKNDKIVATIGDLTMRSSRIGQNKEFILDPTAIVGWDDGTNTRRDGTVRLNSAGDFYEPAKHSARIIAFSGTAIAESRQLLQEMRDAFTGLLHGGGYTPLWVQTTASNRSALVGLEGTPSWVQQGDLVAVWRITFYAPDPYLYGEERTVQTGANVVEGGLRFPLVYPLDFNMMGQDTARVVRNSGNAHSWPTFKVVGDYFSGFSITDNLGSTVIYKGMVTYTAPVEIHMGRGAAIQSGVDRTTNITKREWFSIPPGGSIQPTFMPLQGGAGWCGIIYRDTWI